MAVFIKKVDPGKIYLEAELQEIAHNYGFAPEVYKIEGDELHMEDLEEECLADKYGEDPSDIPARIWSQIRDIVTTLWEKEGIEYIGITPYNFIEKDEQIYIIDFGDAKYSDEEPMNWFLKEFIEGENTWNSDFK